MFFRLAGSLFLLCLLVSPAFSQSSAVSLQFDLRLFTTMAALNAAGFDVEFGAQYHPVRQAVRAYAKDIDPALIQSLRSFYRARKGDETDEAQLAKYVSLAVNLKAPPDFSPALREEIMPPDAREVMAFSALLREFYEKARIGERWADLKPQYDAALGRLGPVLRDVIVRTDAYLRVPLGRQLSRSMTILVELAAPINTVNVRSYQDNYYVVLGDSTNPRIDDVRHAYLHFQLDNLVAGGLLKLTGTGALLSLAANADGVDPAYTSEFYVMATESLIRAIELRMDRVPVAKARDAVDSFYRTGLLLTPYFTEALQKYEQLESGGIRDYFAQMAQGIDIKAEQERFQNTFDKIPVPPKPATRAEVPAAPPAAPANPTRDLLKQGEAAFNSGDNEKAKEAFERVLTDFDRTNGAALYGLALLASKQGNSDEAKDYFGRTIRSESAEASMKVWSYIFLGRIFDLECERERALEYYQQAVKVADDTRNAQAAAKEGLAKPYGDACR
jgi:tetratricopeptide (TPR) repeat protein